MLSRLEALYHHYKPGQCLQCEGIRAEGGGIRDMTA